MDYGSLRIPSRIEQTRILLRKNFLIFKRRRSFFYLHFFFVIFVYLFGLFINYLVVNESVLTKTETYEPLTNPSFSRCESNAAGCLTLGYVIYSATENDSVAPWITTAIGRLQQKLQLNPDTELVKVYQGDDMEKIGKVFDTFSEIKSLIFFCNNKDIYKKDNLDVRCDQISLGSRLSLNTNIYGLIYNQTAISPSYLVDPNTPLMVDTNSIILKQVIDESIINGNRADHFQQSDIDSNFADDDDFNLDLQILSYPKPKSNFVRKFDAMTVLGSLLYLFVILISFSQYTKIFSQEKTYRLRKGLIPYGLSAFAYWASWIIFALIFNLIFTLYFVGLGYFFKVVTFYEVPPVITVTLFYATLMAYTFMAILITTVCEDYRSANKVAYTIFVLSMFMQMYFSNMTVSNLFFLVDRPWYITAIDYVLSTFPSFPFTIICNHIHYSAGYHINPSTWGWEKGPGYNFTTFVTDYEREIFGMGKMKRPSDMAFEVWIVILVVIYVFFVWIFDNKIEDNNGHRRPLFGSLFSSKKRPMKSADKQEAIVSPLISQSSVSAPLWDIQGIEKLFRKPFRTNKFIKALDNVNMQIKENETLSLLGENGAGKSTLISIITGVLSASRGAILYKGRLYGTRRHDKLLVSVCPQYDLLWNELTVFENMWIIGKFRGLNEFKIKEQIFEILDNLKLKSQMHNLVSNLSGGMKRRISIGLALIGNSQFVIFDEPTTGLDPVNRKNVWNFIKELKHRGKTVLLTTHIMDEADYLSDRIAIINNGKILRVKAAVEIKNEFNMVNVIFALKKSSESFKQNMRSYFENNFKDQYVEKYCSETLIKFNVSNRMDVLQRLVADFEDRQSPTSPGFLFAEFIDSFEIASLDLEEAYMLVNEKEEARAIAIEDDED